MRLKGDNVVNAVLDNAISRESQLVRKRSSVVQAETTHNKALDMHLQESENQSLSQHIGTKGSKTVINAVKGNIKKIVKGRTKEKNTTHLTTLLKQGEFLKLALEEEKDPIWKGFIWSLKSGTAKFLLNATIHTLPTMNNPKLWNESVSDK